MKPAPFPQANRNLTKPQGWADEDCGELPVYTDGVTCISRWRASWRERLGILVFGHVWLHVWSGHTQPPVALSVEQPFVERTGRRWWERFFPTAAALVLLSVLLALPGQAQQESDAQVTLLVGAGVSLSDKSAAIPRALISVDAPAYLGASGNAVGRIRVDLVLSGLPGETVSIQDPTTWTSAEVWGELQRRIGAWGASETMLVGRAGFVTRILPSDKEPRQRFARVYTLGPRVQRRESTGEVSRSIALLWGRSEIASPDRFHAGQLLVEGHIKLAQPGRVTITLLGDASLTLGRKRVRGERDVLRLGVAGGWGGWGGRWARRHHRSPSGRGEPATGSASCDGCSRR